MIKKRMILTSCLTCLTFLILSACSSDPASSMYDQLEEQAKSEQKAAAVAEQRTRQDEISVNTYQAVLEAGADDIKRAQNERDELAALNQDRVALLKQEQTIRTRAFDELDLKKLANSLSSLPVAAKKDGKVLLDVFKEREKAFDTFLKRYAATIDSEKKVLSYLTEKPNFVKIDEATADLNRTSRQATEALKTFNQLTVRYNELKPTFYKKAGLNIK
ncbi:MULTISPECIES: YkyA family protein [Exiguobacterium]|uniref:YkyA family protein n=1 Tax=Exiguobacterium TaxID=33986 RepID=UPI00047E2288|nr:MULTISPECIES: YkyA family protein [Exiguobacterium]MCK2158798.1 YkyA family protein [Exiguobacterium sp. 17-1]